MYIVIGYPLLYYSFGDTEDTSDMDMLDEPAIATCPFILGICIRTTIQDLYILHSCSNPVKIMVSCRDDQLLVAGNGIFMGKNSTGIYIHICVYICILFLVIVNGPASQKTMATMASYI